MGALALALVGPCPRPQEHSDAQSPQPQPGKAQTHAPALAPGRGNSRLGRHAATRKTGPQTLSREVRVGEAARAGEGGAEGGALVKRLPSPTLQPARLLGKEDQTYPVTR